MLILSQSVTSYEEIRTSFKSKFDENTPLATKIRQLACEGMAIRKPGYSQCNKRQARAQNFFAPISINLVPKVV